MTGLIIHEWLARTGGSERVLEQFIKLFPTADIRVLWSDDPSHPESERIRETWLAHSFLRRHKALALPFMLPTWRHLRSRKSEYEWMLISSHLFAHHARLTGAGTPQKYIYAHTPARYIWEPDLDRRGATLPARAASYLLRGVDRHRASEAHSIAANSQFTRERINRSWDRDATVIYPPVDVDRIAAIVDWSSQLTPIEQRAFDSLPRDFILGASRLVSYKALDSVISTGNEIGVPVVIVGDGPDRERLATIAERSRVSVTFLGNVSDALLFSLYQRCLAYIFPAIEDFGIMPIEAMAAGAPVIAGKVGGAAESVDLTGGGVTTEHFEGASIVEAFEASQRIDRSLLHTRASSYSPNRFRHEIATWIGSED